MDYEKMAEAAAARKGISIAVKASDLMYIAVILGRLRNYLGADAPASLAAQGIILRACHANGCPLDFFAMACSDTDDLVIDLMSIGHFMSADTGKLELGFVPRFALKVTT